MEVTIIVLLVVAFIGTLAWVDLDRPDAEIEVQLNGEEKARRELAKFAQEWADAHPPIPLDDIDRRRK